MQKGALPLLPRWASMTFGTVLSDLSSFGILPRYVAQSAPIKPPVITFKDPGGGDYNATIARRTTYYTTVYVEGKVVSRSPITQLAIKRNRSGVWRSPLFFLAITRTLKEDEEQDHHFIVEAEDRAGNKVQKELVVTHKIPQVKQRTSRLRVALSPLAHQGDVATSLSRMADDALQQALADPQRFLLLERAQLTPLLREQQLTPLADKETAISIGKLIQAEVILVGSVLPRRRTRTECMSVSWMSRPRSKCWRQMSMGRMCTLTMSTNLCVGSRRKYERTCHLCKALWSRLKEKKWWSILAVHGSRKVGSC